MNNQFTSGNNSISWSEHLTPQQKIAIIREIFNIEYTPTAEELDEETNRQTIKEQYAAMLTRLNQIQTAANPTNAQTLQAIKDEALYIERIMKFLKSILT